MIETGFLGATSIVKIGEVPVTGEIRGEVENFIIIIRFLSVVPIFKEAGGGLENFNQKLKF